MPDTAYTETEALLLAIADVEADSGNHDPLDEYLREHFLVGELETLADAGHRLGDRAEYRLSELRRG